MARGRIDFTVDSTLVDFWKSTKPYQFVTGPFGSTKTTTCLFKMLAISAAQQPMPDGIRRTRWAIVRTTLPELKRGVLADISQWFRDIASWHPSEQLVKIRVGDIASDWYFLSFDRPENQRRLLSLQLTGIFINEFREVDFNLLSDMFGRTGRFPPQKICPATWYGVIGDSNPGLKSSPWYEFLVENRPENVHYTAQPSGLSPEATWRALLRPGYYEELAEGKNERWIKQHVHGEWGDSADGRAVYESTFIPDFHISKEPLEPVRSGILLVGLDFARHPAAVIGQVDPRGRLLILAELERANMGIEKFVTDHLRPLLLEPRFSGIPVACVGDPSGNQRSMIGEESVFQALRRLGFAAVPASTNAIEPRIRAVEKWLNQHQGGKPMFLVDPRCKLLIQGFLSKYLFKAKKDGSMDEKPDKVRPWADLHDALQYLCLGTSQAVMPRIVAHFRPPPKKAPMPVGAWT